MCVGVFVKYITRFISIEAKGSHTCRTQINGNYVRIGWVKRGSFTLEIGAIPR